MNSEIGAKSGAQQGGPESADGAVEKSADDAIYVYRDGGIEERHGRVPAWLWVVVAVLAVWAVYYLFANWAPPK